MTKSADNTPHVVVRNVSHAFRRGRPPVLSGIDLTVARGEAVAVVGRSGCGKSTLLHILAGLLHPTSGSVHVGGHRVTGPSARWNVMFQKPSRNRLKPGGRMVKRAGTAANRGRNEVAGHGRGDGRGRRGEAACDLRG